MYIEPVIPAAVTLAAAKLHLRKDASDTFEDDLINALIVAATQRAQHETGRALVTQSWVRWIDTFPADGITLAHPPVQSITSISYVDAAGTTQTLDPAEYILVPDDSAPWIEPTSGSWPSVTVGTGAVKVEFVAGYGDADDVPAAIAAWIKCHLGHLYANREAAGASMSALPYIDSLLDPYRTWR